MLIRDVPDVVIAALNARARRRDPSLTKYVQRRLAQDAGVSGSPVRTEHLARFAGSFRDPADQDMMPRAWER